MTKLEFTEKSMEELCPIALKLAARLCTGSKGIMLDDEHTMVSVPGEVIERVKTNAGNPGTIEEIVNFLKYDPWASHWAEGMCSMFTESESELERCKERMLRRLAERIREEM